MRRYETPPQPPPKTEGEKLFRAWWASMTELGYAGPEWANSFDFAGGWGLEGEKEIWERAAVKFAQLRSAS